MKTHESPSFGQWLSQKRKERDLTQEELASRLGCSVWTVQKMELGTRRPSRQVTQLLADYFAIPIQEQEAFLQFARAQAGGWSKASSMPNPQLDQHSPTHPNNLPAQLTSFVGRDAELPRICDLMLTAQVRLLTLTGPPGTGKTRLALRVAEQLLADFEDGVFFVNLAPITDPNLMIPEIAQSLGVSASGARSVLEAVDGYLRDRRILLLLDNFEQIVEAAPSVAQLLMMSSRLKVIATSRIPLHIRGEREFVVPPLHLPDLQHLPPLERLSWCEAVRLFVERATDVSSDFELTCDNAPTVAHICARLDGLPLAIELAAARAKVLSVESILRRLESRLDLLTGGHRDLPARQRTLRSAIEWSYDLLDEEEKKLFGRLAVFRGGRSVEAIEAVCSGGGIRQSRVLDAVSSLVDKSLLRQEEGASSEPRFVMLETIHEYAREKLRESGEEKALSRAHAGYFLQFAEQAESHLQVHDQVLWLDRLEEELDNLRAALEWSRGNNGDVRLGLRLVGALWNFWHIRGYFLEGTEQIYGALKRADSHASGLDTSAEYARAMIGLGHLSLRRGNFAELRRSAERSLQIYKTLGDKGGIASALLLVQRIYDVEGDLARRLQIARKSLDLFREVGDKPGVVDALFQVGTACMLLGDLDEARRALKESLSLASNMGYKRRAAWSLQNLGYVADLEGQHAETRHLWEQALEIFREILDPLDEAITEGNLSAALLAEGDYNAAQRFGEESVAALRRIGAYQATAPQLNVLGLVAQHLCDYSRSRVLLLESIQTIRQTDNYGYFGEWLMGMAGLAVMQEEARRAAILLGAAHSAVEAYQMRWWPAIRKEHDRIEAEAKAQLNVIEWQAAWEEGRAMSMEQAIAYATESISDAHSEPEQLHAPRQHELPYPDDLTEREVDVLRLIAEGKSNAEIASDLVLSVRTVERHISNIYQKIGAHGKSARVYASAYASRQGFTAG